MGVTPQIFGAAGNDRMRDNRSTTVRRTASVIFQQVVGAGQAPLTRREPPALPQTEQEGVYIISVAARMLSMHPQTLRKYERFGLIRPSRTGGMLRLYSDEDIMRLRMIKHLVDELRLNLAGVETVMGLVERLGAFRQRIAPGTGSVARAFEREMQSIFDMLQGHARNEREAL